MGSRKNCPTKSVCARNILLYKLTLRLPAPLFSQPAPMRSANVNDLLQIRLMGCFCCRGVAKTDLNSECPVKKLLNIFSGKWHIRIIFELTKVDTIRFGALKKRIGDITNTMLANTLKELEQEGIVLRAQFNEIPPHVEYSLSDSGKELYPIFYEMALWGSKYL